MKKLIEWIKDGVYDIADFLIMAVVVVIVGGIIGWKLPELFTNSPDAKSSIAASNGQTVSVTDNIGDNNDTKSDDNSLSNNSGESNDNIVSNEGNTTEQQDSSNKPDTKPNTDNESEADLNDNQGQAADQTQSNKEEVKVIEVTIPNKSLPPHIADILISKNLIQSKQDFLNKAQELKLDRKLKSGDYKIKSDSSVETIIKILAGKK